MVTFVEYWLTTIASLLVLAKDNPETIMDPAIPSPSPMIMVPLLIMPPTISEVMLMLEPEEMTISLLFKVPISKL